MPKLRGDWAFLAKQLRAERKNPQIIRTCSLVLVLLISATATDVISAALGVSMEASTRVVVALGRLKNMFLEFPDTLLSLDEASSLLSLEPHQCHALLSALEDVRFLQRSAEGSYRLRANGAA